MIIPRGTPGKGEIVRRTGKGAFGKSGKMEVVLRELAIGGHALPLTGRFRQEGQGNTGAVLGTVVLAGVIAGAFVTGHSAVIEQGREMSVHRAGMAGRAAAAGRDAAAAGRAVAIAALPMPAIAAAPPLVVPVAAADPIRAPAAPMPPRETIAIVRPVSVATRARAALPATQEAPDPSAAISAASSPNAASMVAIRSRAGRSATDPCRLGALDRAADGLGYHDRREQREAAAAPKPIMTVITAASAIGAARLSKRIDSLCCGTSPAFVAPDRRCLFAKAPIRGTAAGIPDLQIAPGE